MASGLPPQPVVPGSPEAFDQLRYQLVAVKTRQAQLAQFSQETLPDQPQEVEKVRQQAAELAQAQRSLEFAQANPAMPAPTRPPRAPQNVATGAGGGFGGGTAGTMGGVQNRLNSIVRRGGSGVLVIRSSDDGKEQETLEQDLPVMARILSKAVQENGGQSSYRAMGIDVAFAPGSSPFRSMYLDGYGALFMLNVGFPLLPPPAKADAQKEKVDEDSAWEQARNEVYGKPSVRPDRQAGEPYDESKVNKLKDSLLEALKNAPNIRGLKSEDFITVCVFGGGSGRVSVSGAYAVAANPHSANDTTPEPGQNLWIANSPSSGSTHSSLLTIRVKKSEAEAFAKGKINLEDLRHKAKTTVSITSAGGGSAGGNSFTVFGNGGSFETWGGFDVPEPPAELPR
jgi:hypothetical protein